VTAVAGTSRWWGSLWSTRLQGLRDRAAGSGKEGKIHCGDCTAWTCGDCATWTRDDCAGSGLSLRGVDSQSRGERHRIAGEGGPTE